MKNSNIQWIGEIPDNWEVSKFKYVSTIYTGNSIKDEHKSNYESSEDARPYISSKDIDVHTGNVDYNNGLYIKKDDSTFRVARKGCSLMCIEGGSAGKKKALINQDVSFVNKLCCFQSNGKIDERFLYYYLCNPSYEEEFRNNISGMIGGVSVSVLKNFVILVPPLATQTSIATYLDAKCSEIDGLIADINKQIETLNELKKSTITEAVTKGLNKNAKLKDSGIQWIGMIPEGWRMTKLKYLGKFINGYAFDSKLFCNDGVQVVKISNIQPGYLSLEDKSYVSTVYYKQLTQYRVEKNDIVFALTRPVINGGIKTAIVYENCKLLLNQRTAMFKGNNKMLSKWLFYLMQCNYFVFEFINLIDFTGLQPNISTNDISNIDVPYISIEEQQSIAAYLDTKCTEFDSIISDKQKQISTLEAYKKSLIYEYVTGKKEVE